MQRRSDAAPSPRTLWTRSPEIITDSRRADTYLQIDRWLSILAAVEIGRAGQGRAGPPAAAAAAAAG